MKHVPVMPDDAEVTWEVQAMLLARRGEHQAARRLTDKLEASLGSSYWKAGWADVFMAKGEVERLAGSRNNAEHSLRAALQIYEDMRAPALAAKARASLASLPADLGSARA